MKLTESQIRQCIKEALERQEQIILDGIVKHAVANLNPMEQQILYNFATMYKEDMCNAFAAQLKHIHNPSTEQLPGEKRKPKLPNKPSPFKW